MVHTILGLASPHHFHKIVPQVTSCSCELILAISCIAIHLIRTQKDKCKSKAQNTGMLKKFSLLASRMALLGLVPGTVNQAHLLATAFPCFHTTKTSLKCCVILRNDSNLLHSSVQYNQCFRIFKIFLFWFYHNAALVASWFLIIKLANKI